ncbi:NAD(P)H-hydrate dehydratase [Paracoccus sp. (in: a-proteobacteria)]|uniref:NAD(P)H-hydrate dehydratase n=1 Tax=Paracoccus sp. TaxID=267 RepID=UPI0035AEAAE8
MLSGTEILTTAQMRAIESAAMASGKVTGLKLMERAGAAVAGHIRLRWPRPGRATVLCGPGNNGGDGYVIARHLAWAGWQVRVLGIDNTPGPDAAEMRRQWLALGPILPLTDAELRSGPDCDVYVDAIFGTGLTRPPGREIAAILSCLGGYGGDAAFYRPRLVAVDCPSGLCLDSGAFLGQARQPVWHNLRAALTVAFDSPKPGHLLERGPECCGELVIADIGLREWRETEAGPSQNGAPWRTQRMASLSAIWPGFEIADRRRFADEKRKRAAWLTKREGDARHKFGHGHALILAGGMGQGGAARLSARAALRVGAGLVTICPPQSALIEHLGPPDALMRRGVNDGDALTGLLGDGRITGLCLGPGCGIDRAAGFLPALLGSGRSCVLDADALTALATQGFAGLHRNCVLTPHAGEFARLFPDLAERLGALPDKGPAYSRVDAVRDAAARSGAVVLLKGPDTVIAEPPPRAHPHLTGRALIHSASDVPWLATAGSGDVLAGLIAGLLARGLPALDAAAMGAWLHAAAARRFGPGLIADDLPDQIPGVFHDLGA